MDHPNARKYSSTVPQNETPMLPCDPQWHKFAPKMDTNHISLSAIKQLYTELDRSVRQAKMEIDDPRTRALGELRLDIAGECRRRLEFLSYMVKDAHEHADERWHSRASED
jgi:hypothetical protein